VVGVACMPEIVDAIIPNALIGISTDPPLKTGRIWYRSDTGKMYFSIDGINKVEIKVLKGMYIPNIGDICLLVKV